jgi:hypothetical protein
MRNPYLIFGSALALVASMSVLAKSTASSEIVIYAADVEVVAGGWSKTAGADAAGGQMLTTANNGWASTDVPVADPSHYFEARFEAAANTTYHVWLRLRGVGDSKWNESVWVQFDNAVDASGNPLWRIGSASALLVNLENCSGCGVAGWGWQDNAWWLGQTARVRFPTAGPHTIRVQIREDGVAIDQIVLSPATWLSTSPGTLKQDTTIVPKPSESPTFTVVREPYLQQVGPSTAIVVWATRESGIASVRYERGGVSRLAAARSRVVPASLTGLSLDYYQHEALLADLTPASTYSYVARVDDAAVSAEYSFVSAPVPGSGTVRFIAFGDSGAGSTEQRQLAAGMAADRFDFAVHTGDVAYGTADLTGGGGYPQLQSWFFDIYRNWLGSRATFPSIGNHDEEANHAAPYRDLFVLPDNGRSNNFPDHSERFYSFDYGPVHVVVLDTELAFQNLTRRNAQLAWLEADLAATQLPWKIAVFHRSPYSAGGEHGSDLAVRSVFGAIFDRYHVDLALSGHEHDYERSIPIRETVDGGPTTYIVTGGGGAKLYPAAKAWWTAASRSAFHYVRGTIDVCQMRIEAVGLDRLAFDQTLIDKCAEPAPDGSTPYGGTPASIPGLIQAEHFDEGGKDVAFFDSSAGNSGGRLRATDVDIQSTVDSGGGYNVGWITPGEWLAYSVEIAETRSYTVTARVASNGTGGTFHIEVDGTNVTGPLSIPNTGSYQKWTSIMTAGVSLPAGRHRVRVVFDAAGPTGSVGNFNHLRVE